jgi:hypothetical protein
MKDTDKIIEQRMELSVLRERCRNYGDELTRVWIGLGICTIVIIVLVFAVEA